MSEHLRQGWRTTAEMRLLDFLHDTPAWLIDRYRIAYAEAEAALEQMNSGDQSAEAVARAEQAMADLRAALEALTSAGYQQQGKGWVKAASFTGAPLWHVTENRDFEVDPEHQPGGGNGEVGIFGAGLFVTPNPELWHYLWRPESSTGIYAAQIEAPASVVNELGGVSFPDDRDQAFIEGGDLGQVSVRRVVPIQIAEAEANALGYGFALIAADVIEHSRVCVIDHKAGWGNPVALCDRVTTGDPIKWTTPNWVRNGPMADRICDECMEALR